MGTSPPELFRDNWPQFYENGAAVKADFVVEDQGVFDPLAEVQTKQETYRKTIYPVIDYAGTRYGDDSSIPVQRGGGSTLSGTKASWPVLDIDVEPKAGHLLVEELSGNKWRITGGGPDPTNSVYTMEVVRV